MTSRAGRRSVRVLGAVLGVVLAAAAVTVAASALSGSGGPAVAMAPPRYVEEAAAAGLQHVYDGDFSFFIGGGVAVFDCNADGKPDLYLAGGSAAAGLYRNESSIGGPLRFAPMAGPSTDLFDVTGAYPLDVDGDGLVDLAVLRHGENVMLRGLGDCRFERANERWSVDGGDEWTAAFSATWEGAADLPTLAFGNYLVLTDAGQRASCADNVLFRPSPSGGSYTAPIPLTPGWCTLSVLFSDWEHSGRRDLRVTNDRHYYRDGEEQLWRIDEAAAPRLYTRDEGWRKMQIWGMGIATYDLTGDGRPEVFLTSQGDNKLQTLEVGASGPHYEDIAIRRGVTAHRPYAGDVDLPSTAWHAEFQDVNNDGFMDLFIAKGNVEAMPDFAADDPSNLLLGGPDGSFTESAEVAGIVDFSRGRGAALADFNLDGMLDIVKVNRRDNVTLWRNVGWGSEDQPEPMGNWVALGLEQPGPNRQAVGAWLEVRIGDRTTWREVTVGGGHAGGQLGWIHLGLGEAERAEVRVQWPDGEVGPWLTVEAGRFLVLERDATEPRAWVPPAG